MCGSTLKIMDQFNLKLHHFQIKFEKAESSRSIFTVLYNLPFEASQSKINIMYLEDAEKGTTIHKLIAITLL